MNPDQIIARFGRSDLLMKAVSYKESGIHAEALLEKDELRKAAQILYDEKFYLVFATAVVMRPAPCMVYQFAHYETALRINLKIFALENNVPTISYIFHGSNWYEREVRDFFGITFTNHPDMRPLILSEMETDFYPLMKGEEALLEAETLGFLAKSLIPEDLREESPAGEGNPHEN